MAEIADNSGGGGGKGSKKRAKKQSTKVDMTPMVDLAFLLLTFFILTSTYNKPKAMEVLYPAPLDDIKDAKKVNNAVTILLSDKDRVFYYTGEFYPADNKDGKEPTQLLEAKFDKTSKEGIHQLFLDLNKITNSKLEQLKAETKAKGLKLSDSLVAKQASDITSASEALTVLIKADDKATYKNFVDVWDECNVTNISKKVAVDMMPSEVELVKAKFN